MAGKKTLDTMQNVDVEPVLSLARLSMPTSAADVYIILFVNLYACN